MSFAGGSGALPGFPPSGLSLKALSHPDVVNNTEKELIKIIPSAQNSKLLINPYLIWPCLPVPISNPVPPSFL